MYRTSVGMASPGNHRLQRVLVAAVVIAGGLACSDPPATTPSFSIGLLLSDAAVSPGSNLEKAVRLVVDAANQAGGLDGKTIAVVVRRTPSDLSLAEAAAQALIGAGVAVVIGPDHLETVRVLRSTLPGRTVLLPSFSTFDIHFKPRSWFEMGPRPSRFACEQVSQYQADGHRTALQIVSPGGYGRILSWELALAYGLPGFVLGSDEPTPDEVQSLTGALREADAYLLNASPAAASALIRALAAGGALANPERWYLSPILHTPAFLQSIPRGAMRGARGVAPGTIAGASDFRARFLARWKEAPLDDAYAFHDAGAIAVLAMQRALRDEQAIPAGDGLAPHVIAVTRPGGRLVTWDEIGRGLDLLRLGQEVQYIGVSGERQFDTFGMQQAPITRWWTIGEDGFSDTAHTSTCP
jgi:ABC-type branched-subunit amino acid transport system substrate-binding protein